MCWPIANHWKTDDIKYFLSSLIGNVVAVLSWNHLLRWTQYGCPYMTTMGATVGWAHRATLLVCLLEFMASVEVKNGKGQYICIAPTSKALRYGNALSRDLTVLPAHPHVYRRTEWTIPAFSFPAETGTHLPTPKGWKAELAWATRTVSKQLAQDCYAMFIASANRSKHHASLGK